MKTKSIILCLIIGIIYITCDDSIGRVGLSIRPEEDKVSIFDTMMVIDSRTIMVDSVYAKTNSGLLGDFYDPTFGNIKSSYLCQFYPSVGFPYLDSIVDNKVNSVFLNIYYFTCIGDSLAPMEATVYPIIKPLDRNFYTNADPKDYCDMDHPLAKYGYTARNLVYSDYDLQLSNYMYHISIPLPVKIGQDYLDKVMNNELKTINEFLDFFPGTYITTTYGTGSMIPVSMTEITLNYTLRRTLKDEKGNDSIATQSAFAVFTTTKEVIQLNKFENKYSDFLLEDSTDKTFIKSPAGVYTELTIPIKKIVEGIGKKKFSSIKLSIKAYPREDRPYSLLFPGWPNSAGYYDATGNKAKLLMIEPDSVKSFFEMKKVADRLTSYTTQFKESTYSYEFENISNVVQNAIEKAPDKDLKLWLIPVLTTWYSQSVSYGSYPVEVDYMTSHYLYPSGVALMKGNDNLKIRVIATDLKINE